MTTAARILEVAFAEVGTAEKPVNKTKYGKWNSTDGQPWCGAFVNWCANQAGMKNRVNCTYTPSGAAKFKALNQWREKPKPGDYVFFDFPNDGVDRISHVGFVVYVEADGDVVTIEGNTTGRGKKGDERNGGQVEVKVRKAKEIVGYGRPSYKPSDTAPIEAKVKAYLNPKPAAPVKKASSGSAKPAQVK